MTLKETEQILERIRIKKLLQEFEMELQKKKLHTNLFPKEEWLSPSLYFPKKTQSGTLTLKWCNHIKIS